MTYQLVPPNVHRRNIANHAIHSFKVYFLSILAGVDAAFPRYLWDTHIPQTRIMLNFLHRSTLHLHMSAWEHFNSAFNFSATPIGPVGCRVIIHNKLLTCKSWDHRGRNGFYVGPALESYCYFKVVDSKTKATTISDTVKFIHSYLTQLTLTPKTGLYTPCASSRAPPKTPPPCVQRHNFRPSRTYKMYLQNGKAAVSPQPRLYYLQGCSCQRSHLQG